MKPPITPKKNRRRLTDYEKDLIIEGYIAGTPPAQMASVLQRSGSTIRDFWSRFQASKDLPPKEKRNRSKVSAAIGLAIKTALKSNSKLGVRRVPGILKTELLELTW